MNQQPRRKQQARRRPQPGRQKRLDLWRAVPELPPTEPIAPATDAGALLRSLGPPPLQGRASEHYLAAVVERAAVIATALAASAGCLDAGSDDSEG